MVIFLIVLMNMSIVGIVGLIALKRWEMATGKVFFASVRPAAGRVLGAGLHFAERRAPALLQGLGWSLYRAVRRLSQFAVAWTMLRVERVLERVLHTLRHTTVSSGDGKVSAFLREVAEHKKSLIHQSSEKKNAIYEE
jgi:hypothetical protein